MSATRRLSSRLVFRLTPQCRDRPALKARAGALAIFLTAISLSAPVAASPDAVAGTLFGAGAGALVGQAVGGQQGAVVGGIVGALAGHAMAAPGGASYPYGVHYPGRGGSPYPPPAPVVGWSAPPAVIYAPHPYVMPPRPVYAPVPVTVVVSPPPVYRWEHGHGYRPRHGRHHRHHWD
jgi:hypothetical protein